MGRAVSPKVDQKPQAAPSGSNRPIARRVAGLARYRFQIQQAVTALDDRVLADLERRARMVNVQDGFPASTMGDGTPRGTAELTLVEAAAEQRAYSGVRWEDKDAEEWRTTPPPQPDPAGRALEELVSALAAMDRQAQAVLRCLGFLAHQRTSAAGRVSSLVGDCLCCERAIAGTPDDRSRGGFCDACRKAYERAGRPDRHRFVVERRAWLDEQKQRQGA